jgi:hypothetical protein
MDADADAEGDRDVVGDEVAPAVAEAVAEPVCPTGDPLDEADGLAESDGDGEVGWLLGGSEVGSASR